MYVTVGEAGFDSFLEGFDDVDACGEAKHGNGGFAGLGDVEEIVEERLAWV